MTVVLFASLFLLTDDTAPRIWLPDDAAVFDVRDFGAVGDSVADDTAALQAAIDESGGEGTERAGIVFLPSGTYRITDTLVVNRGKRGSAIGPWIWGECRSDTTIVLADGAAAAREAEILEFQRSDLEGGEPPAAITSVLRLHPYDSGVTTSANWFMRNIRHLTIDVGENPTCDGIRYFASNVGILEDLHIRGRGRVGINSNFLAEDGPNLIQNCTIEGFDVGIDSGWCYGQTLIDVRIRDCREVALKVVANTVGIERLDVRETPQAIQLRQPKNWWWWAGNAAIVQSTLAVTDASRPAIDSQGLLYLRDVSSSGGSRLLADRAVKAETDGVAGNSVADYISHGAISPSGQRVFDEAALDLPIETPPSVPWETDPAKWVCVNDFGFVQGGGLQLGEDNTAAFQRAVDHAAEIGATTVFIRPVRSYGEAAEKAAWQEELAGRGQPRFWYEMTGDVQLRSPVRHVIGLGFARILGEGALVQDASSEDVIRIENINPFGKSYLRYETRDASKTLVLDSLSGLTETNGRLFITNAPMKLRLRPGARCWARHLNAEGIGTMEEPLVINEGGKLWALGVKSEGGGPRFLTTAGGQTEVLGTYQYANVPVPEEENWPLFEVQGEGSAVFVGAIKQYCFNGRPYTDLLHLGETVFDPALIGNRPWMALTTRTAAGDRSE